MCGRGWLMLKWRLQVSCDCMYVYGRISKVGNLSFGFCLALPKGGEGVEGEKARVITPGRNVPKTCCKVIKKMTWLTGFYGYAWAHSKCAHYIIMVALLYQLHYALPCGTSHLVVTANIPFQHLSWNFSWVLYISACGYRLDPPSLSPFQEGLGIRLDRGG